MTIHWAIEDGTLKCWMHYSDPSTDPPDRTTPRKFGKPKKFPPQVLDLSFEEARIAISNNETLKAFRILADAAFEQIEPA